MNKTHIEASNSNFAFYFGYFYFPAPARGGFDMLRNT
jgi:fucose permease